MLDDHIVYALASNGKSYPSFIIKNVPKDTTQKYVLSHLEKEENIVLMEFVNEHNHVCVLSVMDGAYRVSLVNVRNKEVVASESIGVEVVGMIVPHSDDKTIVLYNVQEMYVFVFGTEIKLINL